MNFWKRRDEVTALDLEAAKRLLRSDAPTAEQLADDLEALQYRVAELEQQLERRGLIIKPLRERCRCR